MNGYENETTLNIIGHSVIRPLKLMKCKHYLAEAEKNGEQAKGN